MREIKFRSWIESKRCYTKPWELGSVECEMYAGEIVEQFTGLKDRNGKEIFEGDIVLGDNRMPCVVFWHENFAGYFSRNILTMDVVSIYNFYPTIIGNIHENHDLLKVQS